MGLVLAWSAPSIASVCSNDQTVHNWTVTLTGPSSDFGTNDIQWADNAGFSGATAVYFGNYSAYTVTHNTDGSYTYTPNQAAIGTESFSYTVTDGQASATGTVTITVNAVPPVANPVVLSTNEDASVRLDLLGASPDTTFEVTTDGQALVLTPVKDKKSRDAFKAALDKVNRKYPKALKKLAE